MRRRRRPRGAIISTDQEFSTPEPQISENLPDWWIYKEMSQEFYDFLQKEHPETWRDALEIIREWEEQEEYDKVELAAGALGRSVFMTELLWHISTYGPNAKIQYEQKTESES